MSEVCTEVLFTFNELQDVFAHIRGTLRISDMSVECTECTVTFRFRFISKHDTYCFQYLIAHRASPSAVSSFSFATHKRREEMEVAPLMYPAVACGKSLESA